MRIAIILFGLLATACNSSKQWDQRSTQEESTPLTYQDKILRYQDSMSYDFTSGNNGVLMEKDLETSKDLEYFAPNEEYRVNANFVRLLNGKEFEMKTNTDRLPHYIEFGQMHFELKGDSFLLHVYQNVAHPEYLFCPYKDETNGNESYGAGRYLDFELSDTLNPIIDFNYSYNPLCAYNYNYSCPIPLDENYLHTRIEAGVKKWEH
ncbi:MAG: DUF1684 domain-containing protein [Bacteroidia bacterium]